MDNKFNENAKRPLVLCVEDEKYIREELVRELRRSGHDVLEANNGVQALKILNKHTPALIVSDILMPEMDGLEFLQQVRRGRNEISTIPFLFLSALADRDRIMAAYRAGVDDYLVKPIDLGVFIFQVDAKLRLVNRIATKRISASPTANANKFSPRELEVLIQLVNGKKSSDIAKELQISDHTVNDYIKTIFKKLSVNSRAAAVKEALRLNIVVL